MKQALFPQVERYELFTGARSEGNLRLYRRLGYVPTETRVLSERHPGIPLQARRLTCDAWRVAGRHKACPYSSG